MDWKRKSRKLIGVTVAGTAFILLKFELGPTSLFLLYYVMFIVGVLYALMAGNNW